MHPLSTPTTAARIRERSAPRVVGLDRSEGLLEQEQPQEDRDAKAQERGWRQRREGLDRVIDELPGLRPEIDGACAAARAATDLAGHATDTVPVFRHARIIARAGKPSRLRGGSLWDAMRTVRQHETTELTPDELGAIRAILDDAFGTDEDERFRDEDWEHALGGVHFLVEQDGVIVAHASVVERYLELDGRPVRTGYVEAVAVAPGQQGRGHGSLVMTHVGSWIRSNVDLGALGTGEHRFYERLGWTTWRGPTAVRTAEGSRRTPDEDGFIMVLPTPTSPALDLDAPISCEWRPGDVW